MPGTAYPFVEEILRKRIIESDLVLEIGCGGMQYKPLFHGAYEGLDLPTSPYLDEQPNYLCSAEDIPCEDARFDLVFGVATFLIIPDVGRAFAECRRILRPKGRLVVFDYQKHIGAQLRQADPDHRHTWSFTELKQRLVDAGFAANHIQDITAEADLRGFFRQSLHRFVPRRRRIAHWLIVEASV